eukprot:11818667-Ditylum_brightwellii.AAC.1
MAPHGYYPCSRTPGLWKHTYHDTPFVLYVNNFGMKYTSQVDAVHLVNSIQQHCHATVDWKGKMYCGSSLNWNYEECFVDIVVPKYVTKALVKLGHKTPSKPEHSPHCHVKLRYGQEGQLLPPPDDLPLASLQTIQYIQFVVGIFLWYARALDLTLLPALNAIASQQAAITEATVKETDHLLNYLATYLNATV